MILCGSNNVGRGGGGGRVIGGRIRPNETQMSLKLDLDRREKVPRLHIPWI